MQKLICFLIWIAVAGAAGSTEPKNVWRSVQGADLQRLFAEQELGDGVHYSYRFRGNGTFTGTEMAKEVQGTWKATVNQLCWTWIKPVGSEECYQVRRNGRDVALFRDGYEAVSGTLTSIKASK